MKRLVPLAVLVGLSLTLLPGCATVYVNAPPGREVRLMSEDEPMQSKLQTRAWYVLWGLVPISPNATADKIADHDLKGVRVQEYYGVVDILIDIFLGWTTLHTRTIDIEAQR
jgi:hypothetical protein